MPTSDDIRTWVSIISPIVAVVAFLWNWSRRRRLVTVSGSLGSTWEYGTLDSNEFTVDSTCQIVRIDITNLSERPVNIDAVGWKAAAKKDFTWFPDNALSGTDELHKELHESQRISVMIDYHYIGDAAAVEFLVVKDSTGKKHKSKRFPLRAKAK